MNHKMSCSEPSFFVTPTNGWHHPFQEGTLTTLLDNLSLVYLFKKLA
jgi:hypothetical protein